jgi:hypothetical protein
MRTIRLPLHGLVSLSLLLSLTACVTDAPTVRTVTVRERVPVYVPLRAELTAPIGKPLLSIARPTNDDLQQLAESRGAAIDQANAQLAEIRKLQPPAPPH